MPLVTRASSVSSRYCPVGAMSGCWDSASLGDRLSKPVLTGQPRRRSLPRMGFLSRMFVPRGVRRAMHPVRTAKSAVTPKSVKRVRRAMHPIDNAVYGIERSLNTKRRRTSRAPVYRHGTCTVNHRTPEAAAKCRRTY